MPLQSATLIWLLLRLVALRTWGSLDIRKDNPSFSLASDFPQRWVARYTFGGKALGLGNESSEYRRRKVGLFGRKKRCHGDGVGVPALRSHPLLTLKERSRVASRGPGEKGAPAL